MQRTFSVWLVAAMMLTTGLLFTGCRSSEVDRLTQQVSQLGRQNAEMRRNHEQQMEQLRAELEEARSESGILDELAAFLQGVKVRIITNQGTIETEFFPEDAPIHVFNFISRAESGFYDGTRFHRVIPGFMIQGGDPVSRDGEKEAMGSGGPINAIPHEFNERTHARGVLSMARVSDKRQGAGSQFFIMHGDTPRLDREYTVFGRVTSGLDVVDRIATTDTQSDNPRLSNHPVTPMIIERMEVFR
ncbi:MAG: peptidylprolyl isomerase [Balneolia bacterium]|nr:peptidylprolyl isomerase [Balneolia bacterium]